MESIWIYIIVVYWPLIHLAGSIQPSIKYLFMAHKKIGEAAQLGESVANVPPSFGEARWVFHLGAAHCAAIRQVKSESLWCATGGKIGVRSNIVCI